MHLLGRDTEFAAQPELAPVGESGRRVVVDRRAVDLAEEPFGVLRILGDDGFAVVGRMPCDMVDRFPLAIWSIASPTFETIPTARI